MSVLPNNYPLYLRALDEALSGVVKKSLHMPMGQFYGEQNPNIELLAKSFGLSLDSTLKEEQQRAQVVEPLKKQFFLGTHTGVRAVCKKVFGEVLIKTHANQDEKPFNKIRTAKRLKPFEFVVQAKISHQNAILQQDSQAVLRAINWAKSARDNCLGVVMHNEIEVRQRAHVSGYFHLNIKGRVWFWATPRLRALRF